METGFEKEAALAQRLSSRPLNAPLLKSLQEKLERDPSNTRLHFTKANICRKIGDVWQARESFAAIRDGWSGGENNRTFLELNPHAITPVGLRSSKEFEVAPVLVFDNFLAPQDLLRLRSDAIANQDAFRPAMTGRKNAKLDLDKRNTLVWYGFSACREIFEAFVQERLPDLCRGLGLPQFETQTVSMKLTNHLEGGFFRTHSDRHEPFEAEGRAITYLYYFGQEPNAFEGGELLIFDSHIDAREYTSNQFTKIIPKANRLIAFPSRCWHAVMPIKMTSRDFANGRLALSCHIHKTASVSIPTNQKME